MKIALTGAMGSGKSEAKKIFADLGFVIVDTDKLGHEILQTDENIKNFLRENFGESVFDESGNVKRKEVAKIVFSDPEKLKMLESVLHPAIHKSWSELAEKSSDILVEIPLLFEKKLEKGFDVCTTVFCSESVRFKRLHERGMTDPEILQRDACQFSSEKKSHLADVVFFNETDVYFLREQIILFLSNYRNGRRK